MDVQFSSDMRKVKDRTYYQGANSPVDLRENESQDTLATYHPNRTLTRQARISSSEDALAKPYQSRTEEAPAVANKQSSSSWLPVPSFMQTRLKDRLTRKIARLSSLDSTQSSSSVDADSIAAAQANIDQQQQQQTTSRLHLGVDLATTMRKPNETFTNNLSTDNMIVALPAPPDAGIDRPARSHRQLLRARQQHYSNYYGRSRIGLAADKKGGHRYGRGNHDVDDDEDEDEDEDDFRDFEDAPLPIPYSSSAMSRSTIIRQHTLGSSNVTSAGMMQISQHDQRIPVNTTSIQSYEEMLDDRQGMNNAELELHTKGEKLGRPSLDGSLSSEFRTDIGNKKRLAGGKAAAAASGSKGKRGTKHGRGRERGRSKSPSSSSVSNMRRSGSSRHSKRGRFSRLAARLKLTRKHKSIAKLQLSILNSGIIPLKTLDRDLQTFLPKERMSPKEFENRVHLMRKYEVLASIEYRFASRYETYVCKHAQQESNVLKNSNKKCIPYDYNRVVLKTLPKVPDSDYINASHIDSCLKPNAYIAAQGPNEHTIEDFWRMIWEQKTFVIVMLTKVFDFIRVMCNQYWPVEINKPERYGNLEITLLYEEPLADFVIRTIKITKLRASQQNKQQPEDQAAKSRGDERAASGQLDTSELRTTQGFVSSDEAGSSLGEEDDEDYDEEEIVEEQQPHWSGQLPLVRAPRFRAKPRSRTPDPEKRRQSAARSASQPPPEADLSSRRTGSKLAPLPNEFLHPLSIQQQRLSVAAASSQSIPSTPATPRTPSSAGLDRSSATRRAVKKKRRERVKNKRPMRTQFQVPHESQLIDDDDDDDAADGVGLDDHYERRETANDPPESESRQASERIIYQFHYNAWASHTCPFISSLLHFRRRVRICMDEMSKSGKTGPTVVHCNDGCGRTGTYLCIDANLELAEEDNVYDVYSYTRKMRQSRKFLIENLEQFKFVYDTIEEAMFCGKTWFPVSELHKRLKHKSQRNPVTKKNEYQREYGRICRMTSKFSIGDCAGGHRVENREKNRDVSTVPPDNFRPYLTSFQTNDSTDYINAVFVDGYTRSKEYIVTEWPLHRTISDFWSLIYDHDCNSVILLANPGESSTYPSFLPTEKELRRKFGPVFSAEMVSYTHYQNIKSWIYTINKKIVSLTEVIAGVKSEAKTTQVFQITCWPQGHRVPTSTNALVELMNMVERWRQRTAYGPVCVVSLNGKSRAGVYCAANVAIEQVVQHSEVDVFQAVKTVRRHRPQLIENMTEYKYCYDLILHYVLHYVNQGAAS